MKTDEQVLAEAIALVERDGGWCQGAYCRTQEGNSLVVQDRAGFWSDMGTCETLTAQDALQRAASFCLEGAIRYAAGAWGEFRDMYSHEWQQIARLENLVHLQAPMGGRASLALSGFNDKETTTQEDVVLALKKALSWVQEQDNKCR